MSEVKVRWAVRVDGNNVDHWWGNGRIWAGKSQRQLCHVRSQALRAAAEYSDSYNARLVKVTLRPKAKLPEKSLAEVAWGGYFDGKGYEWIDANVQGWERVASAVEAEVLKRRGLK